MLFWSTGIYHSNIWQFTYDTIMNCWYHYELLFRLLQYWKYQTLILKNMLVISMFFLLCIFLDETSIFIHRSTLDKYTNIKYFYCLNTKLKNYIYSTYSQSTWGYTCICLVWLNLCSLWTNYMTSLLTSESRAPKFVPFSSALSTVDHIVRSLAMHHKVCCVSSLALHGFASVGIQHHLWPFLTFV
jgi:hypothetical protein